MIKKLLGFRHARLALLACVIGAALWFLVPWQEVVRWTTENSRIPDFTFWKDRIAYGTLCAVYVSGYEQGRAAGRIACGILADGKSPASFPMLPTVKGEPIISLARAKRLGIRVRGDLLLTAVVLSKFEWEQ
jgi:ABC-type uncharacterized transport system substrate-binding protein